MILRCVAGLLLWVIAVVSYADGPPSKKIRMCYTQLKSEAESVSASRGYQLFNRLYVQLSAGAQSAGLTLDAQQLPWKRCAHLIATGQMDATVPVVWSPERETWAVYPKENNGQLDTSLRLRRADYFIYVPKSSQLEWDGTTFSGGASSLWAPIGYKVYEMLREHRALTLERYGMDEAFKMVALNRLDGAVTEHSDADYYIAQLQLADRIKKLPTPFYSDDWYLVFSYDFFERYPDIAKAIWRSGLDLSSERAASKVAQ